MKYEMIFGDEALFDGAPDGATHATKGGGFYAINDGAAEFASDGMFNGMKVSAIGGHLIAERRIIKEPKHWTWEDKKSGRLPEVGALVVGNATKCKYEISKVTPTHIVLIGADEYAPVVGCYTHEEFLSCHNPIETPAEKAQREEDEFVDSLKSVEIHDGTVKSFFAQGARAAYRKLKGGE